MSYLERRERYKRYHNMVRRGFRRNQHIEQMEADDEKPYGIVVETVALKDDQWEKDALVGPNWESLGQAVLEAGAVDLSAMADQSVFVMATFEKRYLAIQRIKSLTASKLMNWVAREVDPTRLPLSVLAAPLDGEVNVLPLHQRVMYVHRDLHGNLGYQLDVDGTESCSVYVRWFHIPYAKAFMALRDLGPFSVLRLADLAEKLEIDVEKDLCVLKELDSKKEAIQWLEDVPLRDCINRRKDTLIMGDPFIYDENDVPVYAKHIVVRWDEATNDLQFFWLLGE